MKTNINVEEDRSSSVGKTPRRVKVYLLNGEDWLDNGTGYCIGEIEPETHIPYFIVRNELDANDVILKSSLEGTIQYQRQQETLIVWTDLTGKDLALSFQETEGCADLCEFIIKVQQENFSPDISLYYVIPNLTEGDDITELITGPVTYPDNPTESNLESILEIINQGSNSQFTRTSISNYITENKFLLKLVNIFNRAEKQEELSNLHTLTEIIKTLILYNETSLIEDFLSTEEKILGLIGILEYDPDYPTLKAYHREFLKSKSFRTVIPIENIEIFKKDFHLNFLKDVVLARFLDDQTFNLISSLIYINQVEIINYLKDPVVLDELFKLYEKYNVESKRDGVKMLHQYVLIAKSLQSYQKSEFFSILVKKGLLKMIRFALNDSESNIRVLGTELIVIIIEQDVSLVHSIHDDEIDISDPPFNPDIDKDETLIEAKNLKLRLSDDMTLIQILIKLLLNDKNAGLKIQAFEALRILLDVNIASNAVSLYQNDSDLRDTKNGLNSFDVEELSDINTQNYFKAFYEQVAPSLFGNIILLAESETPEIISKIKSDELLYQQLCELVSFCSKEHEAHVSRPFFLENNVLLGIGRLLIIDCKICLKISALRCLKHIMLLNDTFYCRYIINNDILSYFFTFFNSIVEEDNLANSACLDFLEIILKSCDSSTSNKSQNFKLLAQYIYNNYKDFCENNINYVSTGKALINLVELGRLNGHSSSTTKNDTSFDSEDGFIGRHNTSTPPFEDEMTGSVTKVKIVKTPKPSNLFEHIEKDLSIATSEKRHREEEDVYGFKKKYEDVSLQTDKKKLTTSLKNKFSNAGKKIALSLRPINSNSSNGVNNNSNDEF